MIRIPVAGLAVALLGGLALGYAFRKWVGEAKPDAQVYSHEEWTGELAGFPNAYNVRAKE